MNIPIISAVQIQLFQLCIMKKSSHIFFISKLYVLQKGLHYGNYVIHFNIISCFIFRRFLKILCLFYLMITFYHRFFTYISIFIILYIYIFVILINVVQYIYTQKERHVSSLMSFSYTSMTNVSLVYSS